MGDTLLSQDEIDSLVSDLAEKEEASPKAEAAPPADTPPRGPGQPSEEVPPAPVAGGPSPQGPPDAGRFVVQEANVDPVSSLQATVLDLAQRLSRVEAAVEKLGGLEKERTGAATAAQASPAQLQAIVKRVQEVSQEVRSISAKLQGTLGYDIYHSFKCDSCGTQGLVATTFKCTACGHQAWRGWSPKR